MVADELVAEFVDPNNSISSLDQVDPVENAFFFFNLVDILFNLSTCYEILEHRAFLLSTFPTQDLEVPAQELEKDLLGPMADSVPADKQLAIFDKIFSAYHEARGYIRADLLKEN
ncbi:hypothetical protein L6164_001352 [Bauhinia variegata]|uniref:Uncharacterized protein n=1 Tax=Bauhinia variegata TaxID=167791 RepID=A0ACB9Q9H3_BAUVA|nr:hypothetical protein L6164_001352 [Bauhinia variegata]